MRSQFFDHALIGAAIRGQCQTASLEGCVGRSTHPR